MTIRHSVPFQPRRATWMVVVVAATGLFVGCSDPSENVPKSSASQPQRVTSGATGAGKAHTIAATSTLGFTGSKVTGSHDGGFREFSGTLNVADGQVLPGAEVTIAMDSLWSDNDRLTGHLKSPDFFDVATYPTSTFTVTGIDASGGQSAVTGNLTLHGVTKSISFPADIEVSADAVTVRAEFAINRKDFGIAYPGRPDDLIRDNVVIRLDLTAM